MSEQSPVVRLVPLTQLHPAPWNPRLIRDERFKNLCQSIQADPDFLLRRPVLAQADGTIYAGNMRYRAVQRLGWKEVPAILDDIPGRLAKERALRDNREWGADQEDELAALLYELKTDGSELELLGFEPKELDQLLASVGVGEPIPEDVPYQSQYAVAVLCANETEQQRIFDALTGQGYSCKVLVV